MAGLDYLHIKNQFEQDNTREETQPKENWIFYTREMNKPLTHYVREQIEIQNVSMPIIPLIAHYNI